jgi:pimeloyl-ACP methyl ester carboxylesterase
MLREVTYVVVAPLPSCFVAGVLYRTVFRIRYAEIGSGFPLLATPGGGLNSAIAVWARPVINIPEEFKNDFRVITKDQRNATSGESTGPVPVDDPWGAFASDQLGVMDHLGIDKFFFFGNCIDGPFAMKLMERAPQRVVAAILSQPVGHKPEKPDYMYDAGKTVWGKELRERRPDVSTETIEKYLYNLYRVRPDFVYSVSREFAKSCQTPIIVLPDHVVAHPLQTSIDIASLCLNAEITVFPWKEPPELKARTINHARTFLKRIRRRSEVVAKKVPQPPHLRMSAVDAVDGSSAGA